MFFFVFFPCFLDFRWKIGKTFLCSPTNNLREASKGIHNQCQIRFGNKLFPWVYCVKFFPFAIAIWLSSCLSILSSCSLIKPSCLLCGSLLRWSNYPSWKIFDNNMERMIWEKVSCAYFILTIGILRNVWNYFFG